MLNKLGSTCYWMLDTGCRIQDAGYWIRGYLMPDTGYQIPVSRDTVSGNRPTGKRANPAMAGLNQTNPAMAGIL